VPWVKKIPLSEEFLVLIRDIQVWY